MRRMAKYMGYALLWILVVVLSIWAYRRVGSHRENTIVTALDVVVSDDGRHSLLDRQLIEEWIAEHNVSPIGVSIADVRLGELERVVLKHSAVSDVNAYVTHGGCVVVELEQHDPIVRLRVDGYDMYITSGGYLFPASDGYAAHVPVITGSYKPLFDPTYVGTLEDAVRDTLMTLNRVVADLEMEKIPYLRSRRDAMKTLNDVLQKQVRKMPWMSQYEYDKRKEDLKVEKTEARRINLEQTKRLDSQVASLGIRQEAVQYKQQVVHAAADDFMRVVRFMDEVSQSEFWRSEIVQVELTGGGSVPLQISIVPRSGRFVVDLGYADCLEQKLGTLHRFYEKALSNIGWDKYRMISLRYDGQVVCR